jgi:H+-translocating NAD(P) transhydrogenase subunit beta
MTAQLLIRAAYLVAAVLFIVGLKNLSHPRTATRGNMLGALGMLVAIIVTLLDRNIVSYWVVLAGIVVGSGVGLALATTVKMTAMPQMVALLNGLGGGASVLVAGAALHERLLVDQPTAASFFAATGVSGLIGSVTFFGSLIAFGKLQGLVTEKPVQFAGHLLLKALLAVAAFALVALLVMQPQWSWNYWVIAALAAVLGVLLVVSIGGADMPVVISLLNSYSGLAAAATGFVLENEILIISGALVGASGIILTRIMCRAMNRSFLNVLFGGVGGVAEGGRTEDEVYGGNIKSTDPEEVAILLDSARRVVIVPGYGLAVSQAQHAVAEMASILEDRGVEVEYAIHPVAGRMPGHMNVLLAEADIPYDKLREMDDINPTFPQTDVAIVIGANDVVNPEARSSSDSPIAGMPILDVDKARTVIMVKRSLSPGFAGIPNPLFAADNCLMLFSDGKKAINEILSAMRQD